MKKVALASCMVLFFLILQDRCSNHKSNSTVLNQIANRTSAAKRNESADLNYVKGKIAAIKNSSVQSKAKNINAPILQDYFPVAYSVIEPDLNIQQFLAIRNAPTQNESIDPRIFSTVKGKLGTTLQFIPSTFKINDSTFYDGEVKIEMKEVKKQSQMVFNNFSTTSNGQLLESAGMIYWNATTSDGLPLTMDTSAMVLTTFYSSRKFDGYQLFVATPSSSSLNWQLYPSNVVNNQLAVFPVDEMPLKYLRIKFKYEFLPEDIVTGWNDRLNQLNSSYSQNTSLCSYEFMQRLEVIRNMGWDLTMLDYYLENPDNINAADSLAVLQMLEYGNDIKKSNFKISKKNLCGGLTKKNWLRTHLRKFRSFFLESRSFNTKVLIDKKDSRSLKKLTEILGNTEYAQWLINQPKYNYNFNDCNEYIDERKHSNDRIQNYSTRRVETPTVEKKDYKSITLRVPQMGYINCDRFIDQPVRKNVLVKITNLNKATNVYSYLLFRSYNSLMQGYMTDSNSISFSNIPVGTKVYLIVIGNDGNETFYSEKEIVVDKEITTDVTLESMKKEEIECYITQIAG